MDDRGCPVLERVRVARRPLTLTAFEDANVRANFPSQTGMPMYVRAL